LSKKRIAGIILGYNISFVSGLSRIQMDCSFYISDIEDRPWCIILSFGAVHKIKETQINNRISIKAARSFMGVVVAYKCDECFNATMRLKYFMA
jgi:hypothetical protein